MLGATAAFGAPRIGLAQPAAAIRIGTTGAEPYLQPYFAQDQGYFTRAGLNVDVQSFANAGIALQAVVGGALDIGCANLIQVANGFNRGVDMAIVAAGGMYAANTPTIGLYVAKTSTIRAAKDLEGQTISVTNLRGTEGIAVSEWLKRGGVSPDKVKFFELPFPEVAPALVRGTIAAGIDGPTFVTDPSTPVRVLADPYAAIAPMFYTAVWCAHRQYLAQNAALIRSLVNIFNATSRWANGHHNESAAIMGRILKVDAAEIRSMVRIPFATSLEARYAQPLLAAAYTYKLLERPVAASDIFWS